MKLERFLVGLVVAGSLLGTASAQQNYAQRRVNINAGVVLIASQQISGFQANYAPYVWFNLDSNRNMKPPGWSFSNPLAPSVVTAEILSRWVAQNTARGSAIVPTLGAPLTKKDAAYWEIQLDSIGDEQLDSMDALCLPVRGVMSLNPTERERLRKFMEHGGLLWLDLSPTSVVDVINGAPLPFTLNTANLGSPFAYNLSHPLLSFPATISGENLVAVQATGALGLAGIDLASMGLGDIKQAQQTTEFDYLHLLPVASDEFGPYVSVGRVGDGYLVVTTRSVATTLNRTHRLLSNQFATGYVPNDLSVAETPVFDRTADAAAKFVANMVHLTSGYSQISRGSRKTGGGPIDLGAPLLQKFDAAFPLTQAVAESRPVAVYKGLVIVSSGDVIRAYDANPVRDLNGDGNSDDGVVDYLLGSPYDLVWSSTNLPGPVSPPTCADVPGAVAENQVAVVDASGRLLIFDAFPAAPAMGMAPVATVAPPSGFSAGGPPLAPTYHDGLYLVGDQATVGVNTVGRVWVADAFTATIVSTSADWAVGGAGVSNIPPLTGSPTVGYIPILDNSGGVDRTVYVPTKGTGFAGPAVNAGITSIWLGVKGEKPSSWSRVGNQLVVVTRASLQGLRIYVPSGPSHLGVKLSIIDGSGNPLDAAAMNDLLSGTLTEAGGILNFGLKGSAVLPVGMSIRLDYTLDWGTGIPAIQGQIIRGQLFLPDDNNHRRVILDNIALSPQGTIHVVAADPTNTSDPNGHDGGTYYAFKEDGRGSFRMINRFDLYPQHEIALNQAAAVTYAETIGDTDPVENLIPFPATKLAGLRFKGGPAVHGGFVYVTARAVKSIFIPCTVLMAFQAEPETPEILVEPINGSFSLVQPDLARSPRKNRPSTMSVLQSNQFTYEASNRTGKARIRIDNLMPMNRGAIVNALSRSQPVIIRRSGQPDLLVEPGLTASTWSPLSWYIVFHGYENDSPSLVTGNTVFFAGDSRLPSILAGDPFPWAPKGLLVGMDALISPNDPFLRPDVDTRSGRERNRPWQLQLWQIQTSPSFVANPDIRWPQTSGAQSFDDWRVRLFQTVLGNSQHAYGVVGGDGALFSWSELGIWGYTRADFLVADDGRLAKFDSSGNPLWNADATLLTGNALDSGAAGNIRPLVRPTRAYSVNAREMMVVDTGADRIVHLDISGRELRSLEGFRLDPSYVPDGYEANETLKLRQPRDVFVYSTYVASPPLLSNPRPLEFWVRYLIADAGNQRLIEIIDRYEVDPVTRQIWGVVVDGTGERALGILNWHSPSQFSGKEYNYVAVDSIYAARTGTPERFYAAAVGGRLPTNIDSGLDQPTTLGTRESASGNGGIVLFNDSGQVIEVINEVDVPQIGPNVFYDPVSGSFNSATIPTKRQKVGQIRSLTMRNVVDATLGPTLALVYTEASGVYEIVRSSAAPNAPWVVRWMLPREAYKYMRRVGTSPTASNPLDLHATYARRLDSGDVLIVNGYQGRTLGGQVFQGEVIQVNGDVDTTNNNAISGFGFLKTNLGFNSISVQFELPPIQGARGLVIPVFADRR